MQRRISASPLDKKQCLVYFKNKFSSRSGYSSAMPFRPEFLLTGWFWKRGRLPYALRGWKENAALVPCPETFRIMVLVFSYVSNTGIAPLRGMENPMKRFPLCLCVAAVLILSLPCAALAAKALHVYCGAGMTKPFGEIAAAFTRKTQVNMEVTYANAGQIQSQINTAQEGDLFIAGAAEELKPIEKYVSARRDLVKHIPVLAVARGNPKNIRGVKDLGRSDLRVVLGDAKATPIGKIADKALADAGLAGKVNVVSRGVTAPSIFNALNVGECDAVIVWKENVSPTMDIVPDPVMDAYVKTIPAASLSVSDNPEGQKLFLDFLNSGEAHAIWKKYGYVVLN